MLSVSCKPYTQVVLSRNIMIDGRSIKAREATTEEFYGYVYGLLYKFFEEEIMEDEDEEIVELRYRRTFHLDWSEWEDRVMAINQLNRLNRARKVCGLELIALFA